MRGRVPTGDRTDSSQDAPVSTRIIVADVGGTYARLGWIDADGGNLRGASASYRGLVMALDTGSAIRGPVRADFYMGRGDAAGDEAGTVRHPLRMWRIVGRGFAIGWPKPISIQLV